MKIKFSGQILARNSNIKFHENPSTGVRVISCGRTDRHGEVNIHFSHFGNSTKHDRTPLTAEQISKQTSKYPEENSNLDPNAPASLSQ